MIKAKTLDELKQKLDKALKKAGNEFPEYRVIEPGLYEVKGSKGNWYQVRAGRTADGEFFIACLCRGSVQGYACYHSALIFVIHQREVQKVIDEREEQSKQFAPNEIPYHSGGERKFQKQPEKVGNIRV